MQEVIFSQSKITVSEDKIPVLKHEVILKEFPYILFSICPLKTGGKFYTGKALRNAFLLINQCMKNYNQAPLPVIMYFMHRWYMASEYERVILPEHLNDVSPENIVYFAREKLPAVPYMFYWFYAKNKALKEKLASIIKENCYEPDHFTMCFFFHLFEDDNLFSEIIEIIKQKNLLIKEQIKRYIKEKRKEHVYEPTPLFSDNSIYLMIRKRAQESTPLNKSELPELSKLIHSSSYDNYTTLAINTEEIKSIEDIEKIKAIL